MLLFFHLLHVILWQSQYLLDIYTMKQLDRIDRKILQTLQNDGRISNVDLAKAVHLSATPCLERVRRLEKDGYIEGYQARLNPKLLNQAFTAFVTVDLDRTTTDVFTEFAKQVRALSEISECHMVGGGFDYLLKVRTADMESFRQFLGERLSTLPLVSQTRTYFVIEEILSTTCLDLHD